MGLEDCEKEIAKTESLVKVHKGKYYYDAEIKQLKAILSKIKREDISSYAQGEAEKATNLLVAFLQNM